MAPVFRIFCLRCRMKPIFSYRPNGGWDRGREQKLFYGGLLTKINPNAILYIVYIYNFRSGGLMSGYHHQQFQRKADL